MEDSGVSLWFERLRLAGFKSFVDPTDITIAPGLTGIVGPNGCGKSNLLEALRWVMGESSARGMRGSGMGDVIFAGTEARAARGHAEVVLTVRRTDAEDAREISRRVTREGGSVYRLDGREARARDIRTLLADAGAGAGSVAMVRQGRVAEIIAAKPRARRAVLEEAAGVTGLYLRRDEATQRLNAAAANLERTGEALAGLDQRRNALLREARRAAKYRALAEDLRADHCAAHMVTAARAEAREAAAGAALSAATAAQAEARAAAAAAETAREAAENALGPLREEAAVAAALLTRLTVDREALEAETARIEAERGRLEAAHGAARDDLARETTLLEEARAALARLTRDADTGPPPPDDTAIEAARAQASAAGEALRAAETAYEAAAAAGAEITARHAALTRDDAAAAATLERAVAALSRARAALGPGAEEAARATTARAGAAQALTEREAAAETASRAEAEAEQARAAAAEAEARARPALGTATGAANALRAELSALEDRAARDRPGGDPVLDALSVPAGLERAVAAAFGDDLSRPVVADTGGWRALPALPAPAPPPGVRALSAMIEAPAALHRRLARVWLLEDGAPDPAMLGPGERLVNRAGDLWRWDGMMLRAGDRRDAATAQLERATRLRALRAEAASATATEEAAREAFEQARAGAATATAAARAAREARAKAERAVREGAETLARATNAADRAATRAEADRAALDVAERDHAAAAEARAAAAGALSAAPDPTAAQAAALDARTGMEAARRATTDTLAQADRLSRARDDHAARAARRARDHERWSARAASAAARCATLEARLARALAARQAMAEAPAAVAARRAALDARTARETARDQAARRALGDAESARSAAVTADRAAAEALSKAREVSATRTAENTAAAGDAHAARTALAQALDTAAPATVETARARAATDTPEEIAGRIAAQELARDRLGPVNLRAEADIEALEAEHGALARDRDDLEAAVAKLRGGLGALNRESRERLRDAFARIDATFGDLFVRLFGGGSARLQLVDSDDPLEAGLEIVCQPPGKRLQTLSLLSGGEQTLTALALIFAAFLTRPAPVCVLDEVDAPLDDANVGRFCALLDAIVARTETRFLIVTHHAVTMARMDRLYGVTMSERGVSRVVSVDLGAAAAGAAAE